MKKNKISQHESPPAFMFYVKDFLTSSTVMSMDLIELGAYIKLLCVCWINDGLPTDDQSVRKILSIDDQTFTEVWPIVKNAFAEVDGVLRNPRLDEERKRQIQRSETNRLNSLKAVKARQSKAQTKNNNKKKVGVRSVTDRSSNGNHSNCNSNCNCFKKDISLDILKKIEASELLNSPEFISAWVDWLANLKELKAKTTKTALKKQLERCKELGLQKALEVVKYSTERAWKGLYEIEKNKNGKSEVSNPKDSNYDLKLR